MSQGLLSMFAGGDPWKVSDTLQSGRPGQIAELGQGFHDAGQSAQEADNAFAEARRRFEASWNRETGEHPINDSAEVQRTAASLGLQTAQLPKIAVELETIAGALAQAQGTASSYIAALESRLHTLDDWIGQAEGLIMRDRSLLAQACDEDDIYELEADIARLEQYISECEREAIDDTKTTLQQVEHIREGYSGELERAEADLRGDGYDPAAIQGLDGEHATDPEASTKPDAEANRQRNRIDAFTQVFGRAPSSVADWDTAAALDPHSYDPKNGGVGPEIRVARIRPVPGQGVVRVSQWIEQWDVYELPPWRDFGDNRRAGPSFGPEDARVTTCIDYENGIVVMRQNPSVQQNDTGGPGLVQVGVPRGSVTQTDDGAVRIKYDAGNPFALIRHFPGFADNPWTVNGDLVFTPGPEGVHVDGTRTDYPSMEVYQDLPNGSTRTVLVDPAQSGSSLGPAGNLTGHHDMGIGGRAFEPFDIGGWNPRYDVRIPLPSTDFGSVSNPPSVPPRPSGTAIPS
jgi:hypothetical protein